MRNGCIFIPLPLPQVWARRDARVCGPKAGESSSVLGPRRSSKSLFRSSFVISINVTIFPFFQVLSTTTIYGLFVWFRGYSNFFYEFRNGVRPRVASSHFFWFLWVKGWWGQRKVVGGVVTMHTRVFCQGLCLVPIFRVEGPPFFIATPNVNVCTLYAYRGQVVSMGRRRAFFIVSPFCFTTI